MNQGEKIETWGGISLLVTLILTKALISAPSFYAQQSASAGWLEVLLSGIFEIFMLSIVLKLTLNFEGMDIMDIAQYSFGTLGKYVVGIIGCFCFIISSAAVFRSFGELIRNTVIRGISYENVALFLLAAGITAAYLGIQTQINLNGLILPFILVAVTIILLINIPRYSVSNILPLFGNGIKDTVTNALLQNASFYELGTILFFTPYLSYETSVKKISFTSLLISIFLLSVITLFYQLSVPYEAADTFALPLYQMTRMIKAGTFFQRIEPLNVFIWGGAMFIYVGIGIRMTSHIFNKTFSLNNSLPTVFVFALIIALAALIPGSETSVEKIYDFLMTYGYIAYPLFPLAFLILATARLKNKMR